MTKPECVAPTGCMLGKGPVWSVSESYLWWVDLKRAKLHRHNPSTGNTRRYDLPIHASYLALWKGLLLMAGDREVGVYDPATEEYETLNSLVEMPVGCRTHDGGIAPDGGLLISTTDSGGAEVQGQYFHVRDGELPALVDLPSLLVSNTICFSRDGQTFYTCDTSERFIMAYDCAPKTLTFTNKRVFAEPSHPNGFPNSSAMDVQDGIWTCEWGAGRIVRRDSTGVTTNVIELDAPHPTGCAFGGDDMKTLFITTSRGRMTDKMFERHPMSGGLFAIDVEVPGAPIRNFGAI